jgi:hypothetical protein
MDPLEQKVHPRSSLPAANPVALTGRRAVFVPANHVLNDVGQWHTLVHLSNHVPIFVIQVPPELPVPMVSVQFVSKPLEELPNTRIRWGWGGGCGGRVYEPVMQNDAEQQND